MAVNPVVVLFALIWSGKVKRVFALHEGHKKGIHSCGWMQLAGKLHYIWSVKRDPSNFSYRSLFARIPEYG
jgi:hypothetical protein